MTRRMTHEEFLAKAREVCGDTYTYEKSIYERSNKPLIVTCRVHGDFLISSNNLFFGKGCPACANETRGSHRVQPAKDKFKAQAAIKHNGKYSYENAVYLAAKKPITVTCPAHGDFITTPDRHLRGSGCQKCAEEARTYHKRMTQEEFISLVSTIHENRYDYSKVKYTGTVDKVEIVCPVHGAFWQTPRGHLSGAGCEKCGKESAAKKLTVSAEQFMRRANEKHNGQYTYDLSSYTNTSSKVPIYCKIHGQFMQDASSHLSGCGCPACATVVSRPELELSDFIRSHGFEVINRDREILKLADSPPTHGKVKELDLVMPDLKIAIEYCGIFWHSEKYRPNKNYHLEKLEACLNKGYRLLTIFEDEYIARKDQVFSLLSRMLGISSAIKIAARKCFVKEISQSEANLLISAVHLQGPTKASYYYGLYFENLLVACASFSRHRIFMGGNPDPGTLELVRFCSLPGYIVAGGLGKLVTHAKRKLNISKVTSYVDRRWFTGESYLNNGFRQGSVTAPNYWYVKGQKRLSRYSFAKHKLHEKYLKGELALYDENMSEAQITELNGYSRIYDCGNLKMLHET